jgi:nucleotide-binding universal stress UspA family protein
MHTESKIVVGVDGSASSRSALRWAINHASLTGAAVHAVAAWDFPAFYSWEGGALPPQDFEEMARTGLEEAVEDIVRSARVPVPVRREVRHGHPTRVLIDAAKDADLLVVGSRGHSSFYAALLGSVSQRCAQHARTPVVIIRS